MYRAKHYVRVNGKMYTRGETLPEGLPAEKVAWLISAEAIEETAPAHGAVKNQETEEAPEPEEVPEPETAPEGNAPEEGPAEEADDEAEAPEIDVMAGIVAEDKEETPKKTARKTATRKTTERRKSK